MTSTDDLTIRKARPGDEQALAKCFVELQNFERLIEPRRRPGEQIAGAYVHRLMSDCDSRDGQIFVAMLKEKIVGFVCIFPREILDEQINEPTTVAYISDLVVSANLRKRGVGQLLMSAAEEYSKQKGASLISVNVLAANESANEFYASCGYKDYERTLLKNIE
jgi:ribosomal protein S18 acetylase RimI-like enzyme